MTEPPLFLPLFSQFETSPGTVLNYCYCFELLNQMKVNICASGRSKQSSS